MNNVDNQLGIFCANKFCWLPFYLLRCVWCFYHKILITFSIVFFFLVFVLCSVYFRSTWSYALRVLMNTLTYLCFTSLICETNVRGSFDTEQIAEIAKLCIQTAFSLLMMFGFMLILKSHCPFLFCWMEYLMISASSLSLESFHWIRWITVNTCPSCIYLVLQWGTDVRWKFSASRFYGNYSW